MILHDFPSKIEDVGHFNRDILISRLMYHNMGDQPYMSGYAYNSNWRFNVGGSLGGHLVLSIPKTTSISRIYIVFRHIRNGIEIQRTQYITIDDADPKNVVIPIVFFRDINFLQIAEPAMGVYNSGSDYSFDVVGVGTAISVTYVDESMNILKSGLKYLLDECQKLSSKHAVLQASNIQTEKVVNV